MPLSRRNGEVLGPSLSLEQCPSKSRYAVVRLDLSQRERRGLEAIYRVKLKLTFR